MTCSSNKVAAGALKTIIQYASYREPVYYGSVIRPTLRSSFTEANIKDRVNLL